MKSGFSYLDTVFINGTVITVDHRDEIAEAVGIGGDKIVFVGPASDLVEKMGPDTKIIDITGRTLIPGFIDTHFHPILSGLLGNEPNSPIINTGFENCKSIEALLELVRKAVQGRAAGEWISMMGYDHNRILEKRHVTLEELDRVAPNHPVQCMRTCGHICVYNSKALEMIGVRDGGDAEKYPKNEIVVENGKLTGLVKDNTHFLLWRKIHYSEGVQTSGAMKSNQCLLENGITSVHDAGEFSLSSYKIMKDLCEKRKFKPRQYMLVHNVYGKACALEENANFLASGLKTGAGDQYFRFGSCKFMVDGGSSGPSCATRQAYSHDSALSGVISWEREEIRDYIKIIHDAGCQITAHAVGDLAIEYMVEGYEIAFKTNPRRDARHRIEHCAIVDQDLIDRMADLNVCPSCNPGFIAWNGTNYTNFYGERMKYFVALRSMIDAGIKVSLASDSPSGPIEPIAIIDAAINRIDRVNQNQTDDTQGISILEAIRLFTINGAYSSYEEKIKGSIEPGKLADLVVLSQDILQVPKDKILDVKVDLTMIDGVIEYERRGDSV